MLLNCKSIRMCMYHIRVGHTSGTPCTGRVSRLTFVNVFQKRSVSSVLVVHHAVKERYVTMETFVFLYCILQGRHSPQLRTDVPVSLPTPSMRRLKPLLKKLHFPRDIRPLRTSESWPLIGPVSKHTYLVFVLETNGKKRMNIMTTS